MGALIITSAADQIKESKPEKPPRYGVLISAAVIIQVVAALCYPVAKYGLEIIEPYTFAFFRFGISSIFLLAVVMTQKHQIKVERKDYLRIISLGLLIIPFNQTAFLVGQSMTSAGHGAFLFATTPVFIYILALIHLKERFMWRRVIGIVLALAGTMAIILSGALEFGTEYLVGDIIILVAVIAWGYYTVLGKDMVRKYGALRVTAYALSSGSAVYFPYGLYMALQYDYSQATLGAWGSVLYMALLLSSGVYVVWYWLLKYMEASRIAIYHNVQPVIASLVGWMLLGEALTMPFLIGGLVVLVGVIVSEIHFKKKTPAGAITPNRR